MIQSYFGNGKGKTTASIGAAIRCAGSGKKVVFVQFLKNGDSSEIDVLKKTPNIDCVFSQERYALYDNLDEKRTDALSKAYNKMLFEEVAQRSSSYDMIVLDEVLDAVEFGYIEEEKLTDFLCRQKESIEIVLTGHKLPKGIGAVSDYISQISAIAHPATKGAGARKGIEY